MIQFHRKVESDSRYKRKSFFTEELQPKKMFMKLKQFKEREQARIKFREVQANKSIR